jgi:ATPase subunit of ABC transporter with duplicated ATPase domains
VPCPSSVSSASASTSFDAVASVSASPWSDGDGIAWLESWLLASDAAVLLVAHDRAFLDTVATDVAFLERGRLMLEAGGYRDASERRAAADEGRRRRHRAHARRERALWDAVQRERSRARSAGRFDHRKADGQATVLVKNRAEAVSRTLAKRARAMEGRLRRDAAPDTPFEDRRRVAFVAAPTDPGPNEVVRASGLTVRRGGRTVVGGLDLFIRRGERVAIVGPNGSGKTTLLEVLAGARPPDGGVLQHGRGLRIAVVGQAEEPWRGATTVGEALRRYRPRLRDDEVWRVTAQADIASPPDRPVTELSGGERRRLTLACVAVTDAHLLVLDEPTHHLDLRAVEALERLLHEFAGTLLLASHDRRLVEAIATRVWRLEPVAGLDAAGTAAP